MIRFNRSTLVLAVSVGFVAAQNKSNMNEQLLNAASGGNLDVVQSLLSAGADPNVKARDQSSGALFVVGQGPRDHFGGATPLIRAAEGGHSKVVELLLASGANVNGTDNDGRTALIAAAASGSLEVVKALLKAGADVNTLALPGAFVQIVLENPNGASLVKLHVGSALHQAVQREHPDIIGVLLSAGAKPDPVDASGFSPLLTAVRFRGEMIGPLMRGGANPKAEIGRVLASDDRQSATSLMLLLEPDTPIDASGRTPMMVAVDWKEAGLVALLLKRGANANVLLDANGRTILMTAVDWGSPYLVQLLIDKGANVAAATNGGETALSIAEKRRESAPDRYKKIEAALKKAGAKR